MVPGGSIHDTQKAVNGADVLLRVSESLGVEVCFANPGTTEMAVVDALTRQKVIRPVLALF